MQYALFSQVALAEDLPEHSLTKGAIGTVVGHYSMENEEDGYSLEGFDVPHVTIEVPASKLVTVSQAEEIEALLFNSPAP